MTRCWKGIAAVGILQPLLVTSVNVILSGNRRWQAAKANDMSMVPITRCQADDPATHEWRLLECNLQRQKTWEQRLNVYEHYLKLE